MALGIRGANPIWSLVDLAGKQFDDTYYMWVLENEIPYIPATIYHDPDLNTPWTDPIQFLANGTLPNDVYFEAQVVYRLEFRQHLGLGSPSQSDPLIYLVENYVAGEGGSTPVDTVAFASSNQITNPQFALINFVSPFTFSGTDPAPIQIGPGWFLDLAGTGTVTITQVPLNNTNSNPSNAPYALELNLSGWNSDSVFLRQRFTQNGMLWANKIVSTAITSRIQGLNNTITATLVDSNGSTLGTVLPITTVDSSFNEFTGYAQLGPTTNPNTPPAAYIDYKLSLPSNADIYVTSIQLVVQDLPVQPSFEQDSINRQIDHTYNTAYPIMPVGGIIPYYGLFTVPAHYFDCTGAEISRTTYNQLFEALTHVETVTLTSGLTTFTVLNGLYYAIGTPLEGAGIQAGATITNISGNTITMSAPATANGAKAVRFFTVANGDGSTTFNLPYLVNYVLAQAFGNLLSSAGVGSAGGQSSIALVAANLPAHTHKTTVPVQGSVSGFGYASGTNTTTQTFTSDGGESLANVPLTTPPTAFGLIQPTRLVRYLIRYE